MQKEHTKDYLEHRKNQSSIIDPKRQTAILYVKLNKSAAFKIQRSKTAKRIKQYSSSQRERQNSTIESLVRKIDKEQLSIKRSNLTERLSRGQPIDWQEFKVIYNLQTPKGKKILGNPTLVKDVKGNKLRMTFKGEDYLQQDVRRAFKIKRIHVEAAGPDPRICQNHLVKALKNNSALGVIEERYLRRGYMEFIQQNYNTQANTFMIDDGKKKEQIASNNLQNIQRMKSQMTKIVEQSNLSKAYDEFLQQKQGKIKSKTLTAQDYKKELNLDNTDKSQSIYQQKRRGKHLRSLSENRFGRTILQQYKQALLISSLIKLMQTLNFVKIV